MPVRNVTITETLAGVSGSPRTTVIQVEVAPQVPVLQGLALQSPNGLYGAPWSSQIIGLTPGSLVTATAADGTPLTVLGNTITGTFPLPAPLTPFTATVDTEVSAGAVILDFPPLITGEVRTLTPADGPFVLDSSGHLVRGLPELLSGSVTSTLTRTFDGVPYDTVNLTITVTEPGAEPVVLPPLPALTPITGSANNSDGPFKIVINLPEATEQETRTYVPISGPAFLIGGAGDLIRGPDALAPGTYTGKIVQDNGQEQKETTVTITATDIPLLTLTSPAAQISDNEPVVAGALVWRGRSVAGIVVSIKIDGVAHPDQTTDTNGNFSYRVNPPLTSAGTHTIEVSTEVAGAGGTVTTVVVTGDSPITLVGAATPGITSATLPAHEPGDLIVAGVFRDGGEFTIPAGWTEALNNAASAYRARLFYKVATTNAETVTGFTNATNCLAAVYRGAHNADPIGNKASANPSSGSVPTPAIDLLNDDNSSWVITFVGSRTSSVSVGTAPGGVATGFVQRGTHSNSTASSAATLYDSDRPLADGYTRPSVSTGGQQYTVLTFELKSHG